MTDKQLIREIQRLMDGREWDANTLSSIAELLTDAGYHVRDIDELQNT